MKLTCNESEDYKPHPSGLTQAVCLDLIELGPVESVFQGRRSIKDKLRLIFETAAVRQDGKQFILSRTFTVSLHPKSGLNEFISDWRGRKVVPGESVDLQKLVGAHATLTISHDVSEDGQRTFARIKGVTKPDKDKKHQPSGQYDPQAERKRIAERKAKEAGAPQSYSAPTDPAWASGNPEPPTMTEPQPPAAPPTTSAPDDEDDVGF